MGVLSFVLAAVVVTVSDFGAKSDGTKCTAAFAQAVAKCAAEGGGRVVVPPGTWYTGAIHLKSNVELHLEEGATILFSDDCVDYLPPVMSSWEGLECMNLSPLLYAYGCTNVSVTGFGTIRAKMDYWNEQMKEGRTGIQAARAILYKWGSEDFPVEKRDIVAAHPAVLRPQLVQFNRCRNVRMEGVRVRESPFWTIHLFMCDGVVIRGIDVCAHGFNNDGVDVEMSRNVLIEDSVFDQGDDGFVFKAGRNRDAWRTATPTENVEVRNCHVKQAASLVGVGSELSGGIRNIWVHDCTVDNASRLYFVKTNHRRGGFVKNVKLENVHTKIVINVAALSTSTLYQWAEFPDYETRITEIDGLYLKNVSCDASSQSAISLHGDRRLPARNVRLENVSVGKTGGRFIDIENVEDVEMVNVNGGKVGDVAYEFKGGRPKEGRMPNSSGAFTFYNIMPWNEGREEESARDMVEYVERTGNPICLYSLSMHAEGRPAMTRALRMIESYRKVRRLVEGTPVKLGVLMQSTLGHWSRVDREIEPWQRTVRIDGTEARFCPLDPGFQAYIREVVRLLAAEKPVMIMGDDDIRGYSGGRLECFCPLHVAEFNKATGMSLTSEQLRKAVADGKEGDPVLEAFVKLHRKTVCDFARLIRAAIDSVDPSIPAAACMPGMAWEQKWSPLTAKAIAAKGQEPILRMGNSQYGEILHNFSDLTSRSLRTMAFFSLHGDGLCLLDESDSFPQNQWSKSGTTLHSKLVSSIFLGARGSKIWYVNAHRAGGIPVSRVYTDVLARFRGFYPALAEAVKGTDPAGVVSPAHPRFPLGAGAMCDTHTLADGIFGTMGIPYRCDVHLERDGAYVLSGEKAVEGFSDAELDQLLSHRVLVDADAVVALTKRGFSGKTGVSAAFDPSLKFKEDYFDAGGFPMYFTAVKKPATRFDCAAGVEEFSHLVFVDPETGKRDPVTPSGVKFANSLGGTVVTVAYSTEQYWAYLHSEQRRDYFHYALGLLGPDALGYALMNPQPAQCLVRRGEERDLVAVFNFCPDPMRSVLLKCPVRPKSVRRLGDDGVWKPCAFRETGAGLFEIDDEVPCCGAPVYRIDSGMATSGE